MGVPEGFFIKGDGGLRIGVRSSFQWNEPSPSAGSESPSELRNRNNGAPWGSATSCIRPTVGTSNASASTVPPSLLTFFAVASTSETET